MTRLVLLALVLAIGFTGCRTTKEQIPIAASTHAQPTWVDPGTLHAGPIIHSDLSPEQKARIQRLHDIFSEFDPSPIEQWIDNFKRDHHPDNEIRIYEGMAEAYQAYVTGRKLTTEQRRDVYGIVLLRSSVPDAEVLARMKLIALSLEQAKVVLSHYKTPPSPIQVAPEPSP